jgi:hypothetical protein
MDILDFVNQEKVDKKKYSQLVSDNSDNFSPPATESNSSIFSELEELLGNEEPSTSHSVPTIEHEKIENDEEDEDENDEEDEDDEKPSSSSTKINYDKLLTEMEQETFNSKSFNLVKEKTDKIELIHFICRKLEIQESGSSKFFAMPTQDSSIEEINIVLGMVKSRLERIRYSSIFEEITTRTAGKIEDIFDGTRTVPGFDWTPNYKGLKKTIEVKLKDMKMDTSEIIGRVIDRFNIGPIGKVCLELLPILFFYQHS